MNEEELFCKLFPEYSVNGKPLSPYFDFFESGYEQSENRIEDLEKENAELKEQNRKLLESCEGATMMYEHLTKAKEILHKVCYEFGIYDKDLMEEAKQFLKENNTYERIQKAKYNYTN